MRTGRRANNRITDNRGVTLVELIVVMAILVVLAGVAGISMSVMFTRDAKYVATRIDDGLTEARMLSMSKPGDFIYELHIDTTDDKGGYVKISSPTENKTFLLDRSVTYTVEGDGAAITGDTFTFEFDKAKGSIKSFNGSDADIKGVYTIKVTSSKNTSKFEKVAIISTTGRHYIMDP